MSKNTKILIGVVAALAVVAALLVMFLLGLFSGDTGVTGTIVYRERMALPDDAMVRVAIVDTSSGQPLNNRIIRNPGQSPIAFDVPYEESQVNESLIYVVDATIEDNSGNPLFVTRQNFPVITQDNPTSDVEVLVEVAGDAPPAASIFITINAPLQGAILDISRPVRVSGQGGGLPEGNVVVQALDRDGNVLAEQPTIIDAPDAGTGGQGPWAVELDIDTEPGMAGRIRAYSPSPQDNSVLAEASVNVSFGQTEAAQSFIIIDEPLQGAILDINQPVGVTGRGGGLPEGNVVVQALDRDGNVLDQQATIIDAPDAGTGGQGPWAVELTIDTEPGMAGRIRAFSSSPADNSVVAEAVVEVSLGQTEAAPVFIEITKPAQNDVLDISRIVTVEGVGGGLPEGNVVVQALDQNGNVLAERATIVNAPDAGTGGQGPWAVELNIDTEPGTPGQIRAFSSSPADGSLLTEARINVRFGQQAADVPPTAVLQGPSQAFVGDQVTFQGGKSIPGSSPIVVYSWNFGNTRSFNDSPDVSATTVYDEPGRYDVSLTVRDQNDLSDTATMRITIREREPDAEPPIGVINAPGQAVAGDGVSFDGSGSEPGNGGNIVRYDWNFGDGATARGPVAEHVYDDAGSYNITLIVTDEAGQSGNSTLRINVTEPEAPTPEPTEEPGEGLLEGVTWALTGTPEGVTIIAEFDGGAISGSAGCNSYSGSYTANNGQITVSGLSSSQQICEDEVMAAEQAFLQALPTATAYQVNGDAMTLTTAGGSLNFVNAISPF